MKKEFQENSNFYKYLILYYFMEISVHTDKNCCALSSAAIGLLTESFSDQFAGHLENDAITKSSVIPVLVTGIQPAQVLELKQPFDPTDVGSLDLRHKGEDDGEWCVAFVR